MSQLTSLHGGDVCSMAQENPSSSSKDVGLLVSEGTKDLLTDYIPLFILSY